MSSLPYDQLITNSLHLPSEKRGELAAILLKSLEDELPAGQKLSSEEWDKEISRRSEELHRGNAETLDAAESIAQAKALIADLKKS